MDVSVVIPTFNRRRSLLRCIRSLPEDIEVIVVDDGSSDGTGGALQEINHPHLYYVRQENAGPATARNAGPATARNAGLAIATGRYVAFTDDDCVPLAPWPWPLVRRLDREGVDVAGAGGRVIPLENGLISRYYTYHRILEPPDSCSYLVTANCAYRREVLDFVGGFNSAIRQPGGEDPGLSAAVRARGYSLTFEPTAIVAHDYRESLTDFIKTFFRYGKGVAYVLG